MQRSTFSLKVITSLARWRGVQLLRTAMAILRRDGPSALIDRWLRWLRGERRYYRKELRGKTYRQFVRDQQPSPEQLTAQRRESVGWTDVPGIILVTPVYNPSLRVLRATVESVLANSYPAWRWIIADASTSRRVQDYLGKLAAREPRITLLRLPENGGISANTNAALRQIDQLDAAADPARQYIVMLDHDDRIAHDALYTVADFLRQHPDADFLYSDTDKLDERGRHCDPFFKPDWSPEMMFSVNLMCQLSVFRRSLLDRVGYLDPAMDGAQDWDLYLRIAEQTDRIHHIPRILYHWRKVAGSTAGSVSSKPHVRQAQAAAICGHLQRAGLQRPQVQFLDEHLFHSTHPLVSWHIPRARPVSIVIPSRDHADVLSVCLNTLFEKTDYTPYEVILVDTGSVEPATFALYEQYRTEPRFRLVQYTEPFNFSKACNFGARYAAPNTELLLFLNNDMEILHADWLRLMAQWFERPGVGIVGPKLLYPDGKVQHAGVTIGMGGLASHVFINEKEYDPSAFGNDGYYRNLLSVTGACLLILRTAFEQVGGFDEGFLLNYSDVDLCLQVIAAGYRIVYTPHVRLIHYESISHGRRIPRQDFERASERWQRWLRSGDPYFNPNLSYRSSLPFLSRGQIDSASAMNQEIMARLPQKPLIVLPDDLA